MGEYDKLFYNRVQLEYNGTTIRLAPNFLCPVCNGRPQALLEQTWNCNVNRSLEVNTPITYTMPCCQTIIQLYLAVHKERNSTDILHCIARLPIAEDWWVRA